MFYMKWLMFIFILAIRFYSEAQLSTSLQASESFLNEEVIIDEEGCKTILFYNDQNRLERLLRYDATDSKIFESSICYDEQGNRLVENHEFVVEGIESKIFNLYWTYDDEGRISSVAKGEGDDLQITQYAYHDKKVAAYVHDSSNRCIQEYVWEWNEGLHFWEPIKFERPFYEESNEMKCLKKTELLIEKDPIIRDPIILDNPHRFYSINTMWNSVIGRLFSCLHYLERSAHHVKMKLSEDLQLPPQLEERLQEAGKYIFGKYFSLMGQTFEETFIGIYGEREINDKVRISYINGMLNSGDEFYNSLAQISETHENVKVHYLFRPTEGWVWDASRAVMIKFGYVFGFRSKHAHLLADHWRNLISEIGGVNGEGVIIHYAHSLGGSETDRARDLLTPEEQKMIRVITIGSPTLLKNIGFQSVANHVSVNDCIPLFFDPIGRFSHWFSSNSNVFIHGTFGISSLPIFDHFLDGKTYTIMMKDLGQKFVQEFSNY